MKICHALLFSFLVQSLYPAESETTHRIKQEQSIEQKNQAREKRLTEKAKILYEEKGGSWLSSEEERKTKFKTKTTNLSTDVQDIILQLKDPKTIDQGRLQEMIQEIDQAIENEGNLSSWKGETSKEFAKELQNAKTKLQNEQKRRSVQEIKTQNAISGHQEHDEAKESQQAKQGKKKQDQLAKTNQIQGTELNFSTNRKNPDSAQTEVENLVKNYSYDPETKNISLENDAKAKSMVDQLRSLVAEKSGGNRSDLDRQIEQIRNALTAHFKDLKDTVLNIDGKSSIEESRLQDASANLRKSFPSPEEQAELLQITRKAADLAKEQTKYSLLKSFFDTQIQDIKENPWYPNENQDKKTKKEMEIELKKLNAEQTKLRLEISRQENYLKYNEDEYDATKLANMNSRIQEIRKRIKTISNILNSKTSPTPTKKEPTAPQAKPEQQSNKPQEKTVQEKITETEKQIKILDEQLKKIAEDRDALKTKIASRTLTPADARQAAQKIEGLEKKLAAKTQEYRQQVDKRDDLKLSFYDNKETSVQDDDGGGSDW